MNGAARPTVIAQAHPLPPPCLDRSMDQAGGGSPSFAGQTSTTTGSTIGRRLSRS